MKWQWHRMSLISVAQWFREWHICRITRLKRRWGRFTFKSYASIKQGIPISGDLLHFQLYLAAIIHFSAFRAPIWRPRAHDRSLCVFFKAHCHDVCSVTFFVNFNFTLGQFILLSNFFLWFSHPLQNGIYSSLPYLTYFILLPISGWVADYLRQRYLSTATVRKAFTMLGKEKLCVALDILPPNKLCTFTETPNPGWLLKWQSHR